LNKFLVLLALFVAINTQNWGIGPDWVTTTSYFIQNGTAPCNQFGSTALGYGFTLANVCFQIGGIWKKAGCPTSSGINLWTCPAASNGCSCTPTAKTLVNSCDTTNNVAYAGQCFQGVGNGVPSTVVYGDSDTACASPASFSSAGTTGCFVGNPFMTNCSATQGLNNYFYPSGCLGQPILVSSQPVSKCMVVGGIRVQSFCAGFSSASSILLSFSALLLMVFLF